MVQLDSQSERPGRRIQAAIVAGIREGRLPPGAALPSSRALAAEWGVSRTTATAAYEQLAAEGYVESRPGARPRVAAGLLPPAPAAPPPAAAPPALSGYGARLAALPPLPPPGSDALAVDFRHGELAPADFPALPWRRALAEALRRPPRRLRYGDPAGDPALRAALAGYLWRARGLRCAPEQIVVVGGSQQGIDLCARLLLDPGDRVAIEDPAYSLARHAFLAAGAVPEPHPVDREGLRTAALGAARLAYVTPSHQFPLGAVLSAARRQALLAWARREGAWVLEDDYDGEFRFGVAPIPPLQAMEQEGAERVLYLGTVSKTLSPALRLGYLVLPRALVAPFATAKRLTDRHASGLEQAALARLIESGAYERHVRRARRRHAARRAALLAALRAALGPRATVAGEEAGLHVVLWLEELPAALEPTLVARAGAAGLGLYPVGALYHPGGARPDKAGLVIGYAALGEAEIAEGVRRLRAVLEAMRR
ncbi:MocR-like pyridoxine biosynthesis transcription factor PdxR [Teichococcus aestuarii]|uniref:MocR-like pyridoxine biosynthesis transcription factor PdxR n=1 Tax=Teichococcus aestuarii TaxID=568898 RepID=UPI001FECA868|nr:PLP-dependent aminotransferase family protein [Pseudoroseomonas aestuarii]